MSNKKYPYKFSIVTAVYNTEEYVADAIDSVINQSIGFEENVQLILVNDGSTDRSPEICKDYRDRYPNNIVYIEKENGGVSSARNKGLEKVEGKYVNFLDSDDKLSENTLEEVWKFFEKHYDEIDFVSIPIYFFEGSTGQHILNFKFEKSKIIDIFLEPENIQLHVGSSFFKSSIAKSHLFDTKLAYAEDAKYVTKILLDKCKYGISTQTKYLYRKRLGESSAMQNTLKKKTWYLDTLKYGFYEILKSSQEKFGDIPKYFQNVAMYDLQFRLKLKNFGILDNREEKEYLSTIKNMLQLIDEDIIFNQKHYTFEYQILALSLKYNKSIKEIVKDLDYTNEFIKFRGIPTQIKTKFVLEIRNLSIQKEKILIHGIFKDFRSEEDLDIYFTNGYQDFPIKLKRYENADIIALGRKLLKSFYFEIEIPIKPTDIIQANIKKNNHESKMRLHFKRGLESKYIAGKKYLIKLRYNTLQISRNCLIQHLYLEIRYLLKLIKIKKLKAFGIRILYWIVKTLKNKDFWMFMDRPNKAGDNAQALFEYAVKQQDGIKKFFTINKDSSDYQSLKNIGTTIPWRSIRQLLYFLISDKIISSQADEIVINPFGRYQKYLFDLYKFDFIFLQHGITHNDLSGWLNKADKNIKLFITASEREYDSILNNNYLYSKEEVLLSGFPRYDKLNNTLKQKVLLMPTWRESLSTKVNKHGERGRNENFTESDYFKFYNNLINNKKLLKILEEKNYYIKFCLHPNLIPNAEDFEKNPFVKISTTICDYKKEFNEGAILITDYSSVVFDFAYLQKPVIYAQFDNERIFNENTYNKGYFNYKEDGFGPVCEDLKSTVNSIIKILENNSKLEDKYKQRVKEFFTYHDKKNCQRVYNAILELK